MKTLLKEGSVFQFKLPAEFVQADTREPIAINIWGDNILYKGSERTKVKFKEKFILALY